MPSPAASQKKKVKWPLITANKKFYRSPNAKAVFWWTTTLLMTKKWPNNHHQLRPRSNDKTQTYTCLMNMLSQPWDPSSINQRLRREMPPYSHVYIRNLSSRHVSQRSASARNSAQAATNFCRVNLMCRSGTEAISKHLTRNQVRWHGAKSWSVKSVRNF